MGDLLCADFKSKSRAYTKNPDKIPHAPVDMAQTEREIAALKTMHAEAEMAAIEREIAMSLWGLAPCEMSLSEAVHGIFAGPRLDEPA